MERLGGITTRENPSSSAGFRATSSTCTSATSKALQLTGSRSAGSPTLLLHLVSSSACRGIVSADVLELGLSRGAIAARKLEGVKRDKEHEGLYWFGPLR